MIMWALFYVNPETGERLACTSTRQMTFRRNEDPALLAQRKNVEKVLRDYKSSAIDYYAARGERQYLADDGDWHEWPGVEDLANFRIVPCEVVPRFSEEIVYLPK